MLFRRAQKAPGTTDALVSLRMGLRQTRSGLMVSRRAVHLPPPSDAEMWVTWMSSTRHRED